MAGSQANPKSITAPLNQRSVPVPRASRSTCGTATTPCAPYDLKQTSKTLNCVEISWKINDVLNLITAFDVSLWGVAFARSVQFT